MIALVMHLKTNLQSVRMDDKRITNSSLAYRVKE
jgi:hypothetical protein